MLLANKEQPDVPKSDGDLPGMVLNAIKGLFSPNLDEFKDFELGDSAKICSSLLEQLMMLKPELRCDVKGARCHGFWSRLDV